MFDPSQWFADCERALAEAERLVIRLARIAIYTGSDLSGLHGGIAALRAEFERARMELGYHQQAPDLTSERVGTPWCGPAEI